VLPLTQEELERRERLIAAEVLAAADERAERRIVAAVDAVMTNVTMHVGMAEKTLVARIDGLKWKMIAALVGGQAVAGLLAGLTTGRVPVPSEVTAAAETILRLL
jgi:hypothetical protein